MSAPAPTGSAPPELSHLGLLYDTPDSLVEAVVPRVRRAVGDGEAVLTMVDRRTARGLRESLGDDADAVTFGSATEVRPPRLEDFLRRLRAAAPAGRRGLVLAQYSAFGVSGDELVAGEDGINLVLGDVPLTMVCACASSSAPSLRETVRHSHPRLIRGAALEDNPAFRWPADHCPTPGPTWGGAHALRLPFAGTGDLAEVRARVSALANGAGLRGEEAHAAVFAVHEAVVLVGDDAEHARAARTGALAPCCTLDVWVVPGRLVAEVRGPRPVRAAGDGADGGTPRNPWRIAGPLQYVRLFCREVTDVEAEDGRTVRIVTDR